MATKNSDANESRHPSSARRIARTRWRRLPELIGFVSAAAFALAFSVAPRIGLSQSTNTTTTTSTTSSSHVSGGTTDIGIPYFSNPAVQAVLQRLGALASPSTLTLTGTNTSVSTQTTFGPATILIGPEQSITFFVAPGTTNVNTNVHTASFFTASFRVAPTAFGWILGDFHTAFQTALLDQNWSALDALFARLRGFGVNGSGPSASLPFSAQFAVSALGDSPDAGIMLAQRGPDGRLLPTPWVIWLRPHGTLGKVDSSNDRLGFTYDIAGVTAGAEHRWPGPWLAGATLGYAHASVSQNTMSDKGQIDSVQLGAYGGYRDDRLHVLVAALFAQNWISSERFTALSPTTANADYTGQTFSIGVEAGRKYPVMGNWVQPIASLIYTHVRTGSFRESGATLLEIAGDGHSANSLKLSLGARAWRDFDLGWGVVTPEVRARWVQDLLNERRAITGRFVGDATQTAFTVNGAKPTPAAAILGIGATLRMGPGFKASLGYDAELRSNARSHTIQATLKLTW
jgi:outer membrane autotransporter protein